MIVADDATHAKFHNVEPDTKCTRHSLPAPLYEVMSESTSYCNNTLHLLRSKAKSHLLKQIPDLVFPY